MQPSTYKFTVSYDGTCYFGWQKTRMGPSIQETLSYTIKQVAQEEVLPEGASRTDRGVHAIGQVAGITLQKDWVPLTLVRALNAVLPQDIRIVEMQRASSDFHPALHAVEKEYHYNLCLDVQDPVYRLYSWAYRYPLDLGKMEKASQNLLGMRDFSAFANASGLSHKFVTLDCAKVSGFADRKRDDMSQYNPFHDRQTAGAFTQLQCHEFMGKTTREKNPFCSLKRIEIVPLSENRLRIAITGNRFLYKMARNLVGALLYIGCGKLPKESIPKILKSRDRSLAGITAPAHGLTLYRVAYSG